MKFREIGSSLPKKWKAADRVSFRADLEASTSEQLSSVYENLLKLAVRLNTAFDLSFILSIFFEVAFSSH